MDEHIKCEGQVHGHQMSNLNIIQDHKKTTSLWIRTMHQLKNAILKWMKK